MKIIKWFISTVVMFSLFATVVKGLTIDGTASPGEYPPGQPLAVQTLGSNASATDPTNADVTISSGSQLDAAYGVISNGTLYLLIAGNMQSDAGAPSKYDKLSIFIHTGAPGQNTLSNNNQQVDIPAALPRMSFGGDDANCLGCPGLTFDTGFNAAYWIGISYGFNADQTESNSTLYVNYATLPPGGGGDGFFVGQTLAGTTNTVVGNSMQAAMNNSNIGGVDTNVCNVNTNGAAQSIAAALVKTGVELSISLNVLGGPAIVGPVKVCAFLSTNNYAFIYDQILGPVTIAGCVDNSNPFSPAFGDPLTNNFSAYPGTHSFTVPTVGCSYTISPFNALFDKTGGSGNFTVGTLGSGTCSWTATSSVPWVVITSGASGSGTAPVNFTVATNATVSVRTGTITVTGTANGVDVFTVSQSGVALGAVTVDGTAESFYGCPIAVQQLQTQYGNASNSNAVNANGSELDAAYGIVQNNVLFLTLAGNLEANGNHLMLFFMTGPGGQQTLTNKNPTVNGGILNLMGTYGSNSNNPGLTFDPGFQPNYWMEANVSGGSIFLDYAQLWPGGCCDSNGFATNGYFVGYNHGTNGVMLLDTGGKNPFNIQATINNSNTNGVEGGTCASNTVSGVLESDLAALVRTGVELGIPLAAIGSPTGTIKVCAFIAGGSAAFTSNQLLGPLGTNDPAYCQANLQNTTNTAALNFGTFPGQHFFLVGPEARITSISNAAPNVVISYVTEANTNLTYQLQRTSAITNLTWTNVGVLTNGTGFITQTVVPSQGSTNRPSQFYRVRQTPVCP